MKKYVFDMQCTYSELDYHYSIIQHNMRPACMQNLDPLSVIDTPQNFKFGAPPGGAPVGGAHNVF